MAPGTSLASGTRQASASHAFRKSNVEIVRMDRSHAEPVAKFFRAVWDPAASADAVRLAGEETPAFLFLSDGRVLGYITAIPIQLWSGGAERPANWVKGLMVLPEYRGGPIGFLLLKEAVKHLVCPLAITVQSDACRLFEAMGFTQLGLMSNHIRVLAAQRLVTRLDLDALALPKLPPWVAAVVRAARRPAAAVAPCVSALAGIWSLPARLRSAGLSLESPANSLDPAEIDGLWQTARGSIGAAPVRDAGYLQARYGNDRSYRFVAVRDGSELAGVAVIRRPRAEGDPRLNGIRVATVSEVVFAPERPHAGVATLLGAEAVARSFEADVLLCSASHRVVRRVLLALAYVLLPATMRILARDHAGSHGLPTCLADWWLSRGDSHSDEAF